MQVYEGSKKLWEVFILAIYLRLINICPYLPCRQSAGEHIFYIGLFLHNY